MIFNLIELVTNTELIESIQIRAIKDQKDAFEARKVAIRKEQKTSRMFIENMLTLREAVTWRFFLMRPESYSVEENLLEVKSLAGIIAILSSHGFDMGSLFVNAPTFNVAYMFSVMDIMLPAVALKLEVADPKTISDVLVDSYTGSPPSFREFVSQGRTNPFDDLDCQSES